MRIPIKLFTSMRIQIQPLFLKRIRIRAPFLASTALHCWLYFEPPKPLNLVFNADPILIQLPKYCGSGSFTLAGAHNSAKKFLHCE
jgi:hypothetical protein